MSFLFKIFCVIFLQVTKGYPENIILHSESLTLSQSLNKIEIPQTFTLTYKNNYICGKNLIYLLNERYISAFNSKFTTCNKKKPHYALSTKHIKIEDKRIKARHVFLELFGIKFFYLPFYSKSLEDKRSKFIFKSVYRPKNPYLRLGYRYFFGENSYGSVFSDIQSKNPPSFGIEHNQRLPSNINFNFEGYYSQTDFYIDAACDQVIKEIANRARLSFTSNETLKQQLGLTESVTDKLTSYISSTINKDIFRIHVLSSREDILKDKKFVKYQQLLPGLNLFLKPQKFKNFFISGEWVFNNKYTSSGYMPEFSTDIQMLFEPLRLNNIDVYPSFDLYHLIQKGKSWEFGADFYTTLRTKLANNLYCENKYTQRKNLKDGNILVHTSEFSIYSLVPSLKFSVLYDFLDKNFSDLMASLSHYQDNNFFNVSAKYNLPNNSLQKLSISSQINTNPFSISGYIEYLNKHLYSRIDAQLKLKGARVGLNTYLSNTRLNAIGGYVHKDLHCLRLKIGAKNKPTIAYISIQPIFPVD